MSHQVNFSTHSKDLTSAHQAVVSDSNDTNWLIYGYDKGTNDLKLQETGDGGLEELYDEFSDGKVQYALARVIDPNSQLPKLVFIGWCGSGVPQSRKGLFNSHLNEVSKFFKSFHVQINARDEADVEPALIMKRVAESSGANYSVHKETQRAQPAVTPVNSVYKKTEVPDIAAMQRESMKKEGPPPPVGTTYKPVQTAPKPLASRWGSATSNQDNGAAAVRAERERAEKETREREEQLARERNAKERQMAVEQERQYNEQQAAEEQIRQQQQQQAAEEQRQQQQAFEEQRRRQQQAAEEQERQRQQQAADAEYERQQQAQEQERQRQQQAAEEQERQRQAAAEEQELQRQQQAAAEEQQRQRQAAAEEQERQRQQAIQQEQERQQEAERLKHEANAQHAAPSSTSTTNLNSVSAVVLFGYDAGESNEMTLLEGEVITEIDQVDEGWWFGISEDGKKQGLFPANYVQLLEQEPEHPPVQQDTHTAPSPPPAAPVAAPAPAAAVEDLGQVAIGLYDYEAGEDNEISFRENDRITHIEFASEDWWQGVGPDGKSFGLFPANYVQLQN